MTKIQYKGKHFFIKHRSHVETEGSKAEGGVPDVAQEKDTVFKVICDNRFSAKRLWMNAIAQHTFFK